MASSIWEYFSVVPDPRVDRTKLHKLEDIFTITLCAVICNCDTWNEIEDFGEAHKDWFQTFLELPNGIPSHDTFGRVLAALNPDDFERCFQAWVADLAGSSEGKLIAIDGKALRRSIDRASGKAAVHLVSAWVHENHAVFGQMAVEDKSNEITAIPKLLDMLKLKDATVTIDAIGCQKDIAQKITDRKGQYVLAVKGNQGTLHEDLKTFLDDAITRGFKGVEHDSFEQTEKGHGRIETRRAWVTDQIQWLKDRHHWPGLRSVAAIDCQRKIGAQCSTERRYFISSLPARTAHRIAMAVRKHWRVENQLHWSLDVCFNEDQSRARVKNAAQNLSRVRRIALTLLRQDPSDTASLRRKRLRASWDQKYLLQILRI